MRKNKYISDIDKITSLGRKHIDLLINTIESQQANLSLSIYSPEKDEIINGLFFRNLRFLHTYLISFHFWSLDISEIISRAMLESIFNMKYLLKIDTEEIYQEFIKYGIGQEKLYKLHLIRLIEEGKLEKTDDLVKFIDTQTDDEIWDELITIKLKNFDDIRKIAGEEGRDQYAMKYQPASITVHGQWPALKKYYLKKCNNSLHRHHYIGTTMLPSLSTSSIFEIIDLFYESYSLWINVYKLKDEANSVLDKYAQELNTILESKARTK